MSELKHTPGPWHASKPFADNSGVYEAMIFSVFSYNGTHIYDKRILIKHVDEHTANAKLIAAAPDLLDALIEAKEKLQGNFPWPELHEKIQAAIDKATK